MQFLLGILGVLQICFIPGAIFYRLFMGNSKYLELLYISFPLSLVINWCLVFLLTSLGLYTRLTFFIILILEFVGCAYILIGRLKKRSSESLPAIALGDFLGGSSFKLDWQVITNFLFVLLFLISLDEIIPYIGKVFKRWDAVVSWNRWAVDWASNALPKNTWHYPQLLPANWSISYVIQGNSTIQFFSFFSNLLFIPMVTISIYDLWRKTKESYLIVFALLFFAFIEWTPVSSGYGLADVPVACMAIFSLICLLNASHLSLDEKLSFKYIILACIIAGGAAVTKQAGLYFVLVFVGVVWHWSRNGVLPRSIVSKKNILILVTINIFIWGAWYLLTEYRIKSGGITSEVSYVMGDIHQGRTYFERMLLAFNNWPIVFIASALALFSIKNKTFSVLAVAGFVYVILWSAFLSYDLRNSILSYPLFLISLSSVNWFSLPDLLLRKVSHVSLKKLIYVFFIFILLIFSVLTVKLDQRYLEQKQERYQKRIGNKKVNNMLYDAFEKYGDGPVLTNYQYVNYLPQMKGQLRLFHFEAISDLNKFQQFEQEVNAKYFLIPDYADQKIKTFIDKNTSSSKLTKLGVNGSYTLYLRNIKNEQK